MLRLLASVLAGFAVGQPSPAAEDRSLTADLLIVGGNESGCAVAVQAARLGVQRIVLVNDIDWLGGQFSAEGVGCIDEWTTVRGKRANFPRSGLFLEVMQRIRAHNSKQFGIAAPGNAFCGTDTIEPAAAAQLFEELLAPYTEQGTKQIQILRGWELVTVGVESKRVTGATFTKNATLLNVRAKLSVDSSDWGDVIRLSGARYSAGPDLKARFGEASAPEKLTGEEHNEMNPLSWCVVLREAGRVATIQSPVGYDARSFVQLDQTPPFVDSAMTDGIYSPAGWSVYTHRRLVDRWHNGFPVGTEKTLLNWPVQDYPLFNYPKRVVDALDATEKGAAQRNIVDMTPAQRRIVFADAKQ
ncbi:MAG: FAD-dependent oxidoreductase, partial [Verrucomicrobia bacterium]|nr:FAD-dependent oxidoreductase [Verrucomicrobiota bacterium]